jgi:hypothetical protein
MGIWYIGRWQALNIYHVNTPCGIDDVNNKIYMSRIIHPLIEEVGDKFNVKIRS